MNLHKLKNTEQLRQFLEGSQAIMFSFPADKVFRYQFIQEILKQFHYRVMIMHWQKVKTPWLFVKFIVMLIYLFCA